MMETIVSVKMLTIHGFGYFTVQQLYRYYQAKGHPSSSLFSYIMQTLSIKFRCVLFKLECLNRAHSLFLI